MAVSEVLETKIAQLYVGLIGRAPDRDGLEFWAQGYTRDVDNGQSADAAMRGVAQRMFDSDGARDYYPEGLSDQQIVERFYENVLGRQGDAEGIAYWTDALAKSGTDTGDVLVSMIDAVTGYSGDDPAGVTSKQLFENKAAVADYYVDNVSQAGDAADIAGATALLGAVTEDTDTTSENAIDSFVSTNYEQAPAGEGLDVPFEIIQETRESDTSGYGQSHNTFDIESELSVFPEPRVGLIEANSPTQAYITLSDESNLIAEEFDTFAVDVDSSSDFRIKFTPDFSGSDPGILEAVLYDESGRIKNYYLEPIDSQLSGFDQDVYYSPLISGEFEPDPSEIKYLSLQYYEYVGVDESRAEAEKYQVEIDLVGTAQSSSEVEMIS